MLESSLKRWRRPGCDDRLLPGPDIQMDTAQRESYRFRPSLILKFALAVLLGQRRDMSTDADATLSGAQPIPRIIDDHYVPAQGPFVLIANHYERPGLKVFWGGMLASAAVGRRRGESKGLHWLMTSEWYDFRISFLPVPVWLIRWLFRRLADVYGLIIVPRATAKLVGRAAAMRSILQVIDRQQGAIALYPEGIGKGALIDPQPGTGALLLLLSNRGVPVLPVGLFEEGEVLTARFGPSMLLSVPSNIDKDMRDELARRQMMIAIGRLLPDHLWGAYKADIQESFEREQDSKQADR